MNVRSSGKVRRRGLGLKSDAEKKAADADYRKRLEALLVEIDAPRPPKDRKPKNSKVLVTEADGTSHVENARNAVQVRTVLGKANRDEDGQARLLAAKLLDAEKRKGKPRYSDVTGPSNYREAIRASKGHQPYQPVLKPLAKPDFVPMNRRSGYVPPYGRPAPS